MNAMTAAHRTLPFGTWVWVERKDNGRRVQVRINDRGPFIKGRVIDLSKEAARRLGIQGKGIVPVRLKVIGASLKKRPNRLSRSVQNFN